MADYYSVITRAVSNLTVEARWAVYDDACTALQERLLTLDPPISGRELASEQLALESAIRKVEEDLLLGTMRRFVREEDAPPVTSSSTIISVREFVRSGGNKLNDVMIVVRDCLRLHGATELIPSKEEITARLAESAAFIQRMQFQTKAAARRIYLSIFGEKRC